MTTINNSQNQNSAGSLRIRKSHERGGGHNPFATWLRTKHTFSFANYYDPKFNSYGPLRVLNEDFVDAQQGFGAHPHRDFEIYSYIVDGELTHQDSMGNIETLKRGDVQFTSAGSGIVHSEVNDHPKDDVHFLQIWVSPNQKGLKPEYQTRSFSEEDKANRLCLFVTGDKEEAAKQTPTPIVIHQDTRTYCSILEKGKTVSHKLGNDRKAYLHLVTKFNGQIKVNNQETLSVGDGLFIEDVNQIDIEGLSEKAEFILFDIPKH